jgi:hypothetical protein
MFGLLALQSGGATPGKPINDDDKPHEDLNRLGTFIAKALAQAHMKLQSSKEEADSNLKKCALKVDFFFRPTG